MRVGDKDDGNGWVQGNGRGGRIVRAQWKRRGHRADDLGCAVWKEAGDAAERALAQIVEDAETSSDRGTPILFFATQLIRQSHPRCNVSIGRLVERSAARGQGHGRWIV